MISTLLNRAPSLGLGLPMTQNQALMQNMALGTMYKMRNMATTTKATELSNPVPPAKAGSDEEIPSIFDQATGIERAEIEYPDLFKHNEVVRGPFGTKDNPVKIQSYYEHRIVGCTGRPAPDDHDVSWLLVEKDKLFQCSICGQYFVLDPL